ncbi:phosphatase PAP2 family protein [Terriglobus aquaticus]|uniref:Phosphatase PAP2 family protein n=1 Tax=Terriglobus aquaticus TaxID=940139 RepID=A0ABW9KJN8_9BACT|nr:phosphatase PAP2 family protein [Terriglobus aquaticus]
MTKQSNLARRTLATISVLAFAATSPAYAQSTLPDAPSAQAAPSASRSHDPQNIDDLSLKGTPKRIVLDEVKIVTSPARLRSRDLVWLLPVAGATAASLATDSYTMRNVVSRNPDFNSAATTSSDVLRGAFIGVPVVLFGAGELTHQAKPREAGLLAGEAMVNAYATSEAIKYITLRERPNLQNARGHFFQGDAASDPSFVSGHSIVAWSSAAVLASEYSKPWQQVGIYTLATGASLTRVLGQNHFPTDALLGSVSGWLIGKYVYRSHHRR